MQLKYLEMDNNMTLTKVNSIPQLTIPVEDLGIEEGKTTSDVNFISANTVPISLKEIKEEHIIPVFSKSNEKTISHVDFVETVEYIANQVYSGEQILKPAIRVSHKISGRHPKAIHKSVKELQESDITTFYERAAFVIEIPSIKANIAGNDISLAIGGVRSYSETNLNSRKNLEAFRIFAGFINKICTNLCISTDGVLTDVRVGTVSELAKAAYSLFDGFNVYRELDKFNKLPETTINESQFAQIVGRARLYQGMPNKDRIDIPAFPLLDSQVNSVVKDYYSDKSFCRDDSGNLSLWNMFNLLTGSNKSSYIDSFLFRGMGCQQFVAGLNEAIGINKYHWFIN